MNAGELPVSEERTVFEAVALAGPDHHHLFDDNLRLAGTLELDGDGACLGRAAALVPLADAAILHRIFLDAFALAVLYATRYAVAPSASAFPASTTTAGLYITEQHCTQLYVHSYKQF